MFTVYHVAMLKPLVSGRSFYCGALAPLWPFLKYTFCKTFFKISISEFYIVVLNVTHSIISQLKHVIFLSICTEFHHFHCNLLPSTELFWLWLLFWMKTQYTHAVVVRVQVNQVSGAVGALQGRAFSLSGLFSTTSKMKECAKVCARVCETWVTPHCVCESELLQRKKQQAARDDGVGLCAMPQIVWLICSPSDWNTPSIHRESKKNMQVQNQSEFQVSVT